jgi:hypothetical protein
MASLIDKIRSALGRRAPQPRETSEAYGAARSEEGAPPLAGEPTIGSGFDMQVEGMPAGGAFQPEPDTGPVKDQGAASMINTGAAG